MAHNNHRIDKEGSRKDPRKYLDGKFYKKFAKVIVKNLPPVPESVLESFLEKERERKYARQIKMVEGFNRGKDDERKAT